MQDVTESDIRATIASARVTDARFAIQFDERVSRGDARALAHLISGVVRLFFGHTRRLDLETTSRVARSFLT